mmetsp:Transcript_16898/g.49442  ORF Transcript_16898/g.49442 Transcript_16898/m.49442 type:complete len:206 (-) Transcript_16898:34-651(-)
MSVCRVADVRILQAEAAVNEDMRFEITLDVAEPLAEDAVFRCMYVVDPSNAKTDIELDSIDVGNGPGLQAGLMRFEFEASPPSRDVIVKGGGTSDVAGLYVSGVYRGAEFCRVGYYVRYEYTDPRLQESPPEEIAWPALQRVLSDPRVTRFLVNWDQPPEPAVEDVEGAAAGQGEDHGLPLPGAPVAPGLAAAPPRDRSRSRDRG